MPEQPSDSENEFILLLKNRLNRQATPSLLIIIFKFQIFTEKKLIIDLDHAI